MGRNETRRWGCERETLGSLGNEMNSHCHFQIAGFGVKRMSELESPASSTGHSHWHPQGQESGRSQGGVWRDAGGEGARTGKAEPQLHSEDGEEKWRFIHTQERFALFQKWKTESEGKQQISQLGTADGWMGDVGPVGAREQYWNLSNCWRKVICPSKVLYHHLVKAKQSFQMKIEAVC